MQQIQFRTGQRERKSGGGSLLVRGSGGSCMARGRPIDLLFVPDFLTGDRGGTVVKVLCYKSEGRWFESRWCHWNFSLT